MTERLHTNMLLWGWSWGLLCITLVCCRDLGANVCQQRTNSSLSISAGTSLVMAGGQVHSQLCWFAEATHPPPVVKPLSDLWTLQKGMEPFLKLQLRALQPHFYDIDILVVIDGCVWMKPNTSPQVCKASAWKQIEYLNVMGMKRIRFNNMVN